MVALLDEVVEVRVDVDELVIAVRLLVPPLGVGIVDVADEETWLQGVHAKITQTRLRLVRARRECTYMLKRKVLLTGRTLLFIGSGR